MNNKNQWLDLWNQRYSNSEYAYGTEPNLFLAQSLTELPVGKALFAAEGEGRNSIYAATKGWDVSAFDISEAGKKKALQLAVEKEVLIAYQVGQLNELYFTENSFDALILIFAHFPASIKSDYHKKLVKLLKIGGVIIFEAFSKAHLPLRQENPKIGGPDNLDDLFSLEEIQSDFKDFTFLNLEEKQVELSEGLYHQGIGSVIRFTAVKK